MQKFLTNIQTIEMKAKSMLKLNSNFFGQTRPAVKEGLIYSEPNIGERLDMRLLLKKYLILAYLLCISTSFWVLRAPNSWLKHLVS